MPIEVFFQNKKHRENFYGSVILIWNFYSEISSENGYLPKKLQKYRK